MINRDKRSLILSMILGDGCLHYINNRKQQHGGLTIDHGLAQSDYITWKAKLVSEIVERDIKLRQGHRGNSIQFSVCWRPLRAWRKFCYPNGKKALTRILPFITHPEMAIAIWLCDDGYVEPSFSKLADGSKKNYGARFRIFTNSQPIDDHDFFIKWFQTNLDVTPIVKTTKDRGKIVPYLKFTQADSLKLWEKIRHWVLVFKSMRYKFRYIEDLYQKKILQRILETK